MRGWGGLGGHTGTHQGQPGRGNAGQSLYCGFRGKAGEAGQAGLGLNSFSGPGVQVLPLEVWDPMLGQSGPKCKAYTGVCCHTGSGLVGLHIKDKMCAVSRDW